MFSRHCLHGLHECPVEGPYYRSFAALKFVALGFAGIALLLRYSWGRNRQESQSVCTYQHLRTNNDGIVTFLFIFSDRCLWLIDTIGQALDPSSSLSRTSS